MLSFSLGILLNFLPIYLFIFQLKKIPQWFVECLNRDSLLNFQRVFFRKSEKLLKEYLFHREFREYSSKEFFQELLHIFFRKFLDDFFRIRFQKFFQNLLKNMPRRVPWQLIQRFASTVFPRMFPRSSFGKYKKFSKKMSR